MKITSTFCLFIEIEDQMQKAERYVGLQYIAGMSEVKLDENSENAVGDRREVAECLMENVTAPIGCPANMPASSVGSLKDAEEFYKDSSRYNGCSSRCKNCEQKRSRNRRYTRAEIKERAQEIINEVKL